MMFRTDLFIYLCVLSSLLSYICLLLMFVVNSKLFFDCLNDVIELSFIMNCSAVLVILF